MVANQAKSTWELLRKERDFHKTHQDRVNGEKITISGNIRKIKEMLETYEDRIEEIKKKLQATVKEKALLKLEKEKIQKKVDFVSAEIKETEERAQKEFEDHQKRQAAAKNRSASPVKGKLTPYPTDDARPNPWLSRTYDDVNPRMQAVKKIDAHKRGIGGFGLHLRKNIVATASDDCSWKIWNLDNGENIMTGEGHKDWICTADFHPMGSHLATAGGDRSIKVWDFVSAGIAHTFSDVHTQPVWKVKYHDSGHFLLSAGGDGAVKLFDLNALKMVNQYRSHTDSVNGLNFQPFTNFFVTGSADKTVSIWDMRTGLTVQTFYGHLNAIKDAAFSTGGHYIASCDSDGLLKVWDIRMVQQLMQVDTGNAIALSVAFDRNAKYVAVGSSDAEIRMVSMQGDKLGEISAVLKGHEDAVNGVTFNHDNNALYSVSSDGTVRTWK